MIGRSNAVTIDKYTYLGKEVTITFGGYKTYTSGRTSTGSTVGGRIQNATTSIVEKDRRYGWYHGEKRYTSGDTIELSGGTTAGGGEYTGGSLSTPLASNEYFMYAAASNNQVYIVADSSVSSNGVGNDIEVGTTSAGLKVYFSKSIPTRGASKSTSYQVPYWTYDLDEYDLTIM